jgi:transposase-like protein
MISITIDISAAKSMLEAGRREGQRRMGSVAQWAREGIRQILDAVLKAELTVLLERENGECEGQERNWRNGYRRRTLSLAGLGPVEVRVPRDRQGHYRTEILPFRKRRTQELEELASEMFLAGLSTRDVGRVLERHFGDRFDSKEISRMVAATGSELDAWRQRQLGDTTYRFLFCDGANFKVRRGKMVERIPFLCVVGARADNERMEVLAIELGDREHKQLWAELFQSLARRGLQMEAVELGIMDGLPGLEDAFRAAFANAQSQRCQVHAKSNALKRVGKQARGAFKEDINRIFYAANEAAARLAFTNFRQQWEKTYPSAVALIVRDLDSLLSFYRWQPNYWPTLRTTNPIERVNKEFKRRTKAMEITGGEQTTYRLLAYVGLTMNLTWRYYSLSTSRNFYTLQAA